MTSTSRASSVYGGLVVPMRREENSMTYESASARLTGRCKDSRQINKKTILRRVDPETIAVRLHNTDVVTFKADGRVIFDSGGWRSVTTKARINEFTSGFGLSQEKGVWFICKDHKWSEQVVYADGITWTPGKGWSGEGEDPKETAKLVETVKAFTEGYMQAFDVGKVRAPSGGDCWGCLLRGPDGQEPLGRDHVLEHIKEKYFVPSLLANAIKRFPVSRAAMAYVSDKWAGTDNGSWARGIGFEQLKKSLYRYVKEQVGIAA